MSHLIQPIDIEGVKYCLTCQSNRITQGVATDLDFFGANGAIISSNCGPWQLAEVLAGPGLVGEISLGVSCVESVTFLITPFYDPLAPITEVEVEVRINNVFDSSFSIGSDPSEVTITVSPGACGAVITFQVRSGTADTVDLAVTGVG